MKDKLEKNIGFKKDLLHEKVVREFGKEIFNLFTKKSLRYIRSFLIYLFDSLNKRIDLDYIVEQYKNDRFVQLSDIPQGDLLKLVNLIYILVDEYGFEGKELSPVSPAYLDTILTNGAVNNKTTLQTIRLNQVVADVTTVLALESAKIREDYIKTGKHNEVVELCTLHRCLRTQYFPPELKFLPHYSIFAITTAGKKNNGFDKEREVFGEHLLFYLDLFKLLSLNDFNFKNISIYISDIRIAEKIISVKGLDRKDISKKTTNLNYSILSEVGKDNLSKVKDINQVNIKEVSEYIEKLKLLEKNLIENIRKQLNEQKLFINIFYDLGRIAGISYYDSYCFKIIAENKDGEIIPLVDAGFSDWTRKILKNNKEFFFSSGIGIELLYKYFKS